MGARAGDGALNRITFDPATEFAPVWTRDGKRLVYSVHQTGNPQIYWKLVDGTQQAALLVSTRRPAFPAATSPDGRDLLFVEQTAPTGWDVFVKRLGNDAPPQRVLGDPFQELQPSLSPDGRWLAYASNELGGWEVFVRSYPDLRKKWQVSRDGGYEPRWAPRKPQLIYRKGREYRVVTARPGSDFVADAPRLMFEGTYAGGMPAFTRYEVDHDSKLFLVRDTGAAPHEVRVVMNWPQDVKARAGSGAPGRLSRAAR